MGWPSAARTRVRFPTMTLIAGLALMTAACVGPASAQVQSEVRTFHIPAQPLTSALNAFGRQAGVQVTLAASTSRGLTAHAVDGQYTTQQALSQLLRGTGIVFRITSDRIAVIGERASTGNGAALVENAISLDTINVQGENGWGPVNGLVAQKTVTGSKTDTPVIEVPQSISVVTADQIRQQGAQTVSEALRYTPGVDSEAFGYDARFNHLTIRGFQVDKYQYVDGLKFPAGNYAIPRIEPYGLERVEVLRGPTSGLYGQNVPGGLINLISKRPSEETIREVQIGTGFPAQGQGAFDLSGAANAEKSVLYRLVGAGSFGDTQVDHTTDKRMFFAPSVTFKPTEDTKLTILSHVQRDNVEGWSGTFLPMQGTLLPNPNGRIPTSRFVGEPGYDHYMRDQNAIGYEFEHRFSDTLIFRSSARYADVNVDAPNVYPNGLEADLRTLDRDTLRFRDHVRNATTDNNITTKFDLGPTSHTVLAGLDYQWVRDRDRFDGSAGPTPPLEIFNPVYGATLPGVIPMIDNDIEQRQLGIYLQDQIRLSNWLLTLGGREDWAHGRITNMIVPNSAPTTTNDTAFTGRAGLTYLFENGLAPYISYSTSFEPTVGATYEGNLFVPTTGQQYEAGVKYQPAGSRMLITAAGYQLTQQNVLTADNRPAAPPFSQIQQGEIRLRGAELEAKVQAWNGWDLIGSYTFSDAVVTRSNSDVNGVPVQGRFVTSIPRHQTALWAKYTFDAGPLAGFGLAAGLRYRSSVYADDLNQLTVPPVTLLDAGLSYDLGKANPQWKGLTLNVNASNLLGKNYVANCQYGVCYYGLSRTVIAKLTYRW